MLLQKELEKAQKKYADLEAKFRSISAEKLQARAHALRVRQRLQR